MARQTLTLSQALHFAFAAYKSKSFFEAEQILQQLVSAKSDLFEVLHLLAVVQSLMGKNELALANYDRALIVQPDNSEALNNRGLVLHELKRFAEALESYERALTLHPNNADILNNRGNSLRELKRFDAALASYDRALSLVPNNADMLNNRGLSLYEMGRLEEALESYTRALIFRPNYVEALNNRGITLRKLKRLGEALECIDRALVVKPECAEAFSNRGNILLELNRVEEALACHDRALSLRPNYPEALYNRGNCLKELKQFDDALASFDCAIAGNWIGAYAFSGIAECVLKLCDWDRRARIDAEIISHALRGNMSIISPFVLLGYNGDPALQLQCATSFFKNQTQLLPRPIWSSEKWHHTKIRVTYISGDFHSHATASLIAELFEQHDRSQFEVIGISFGVDDVSVMRKRLASAFDRFYDVRLKNDMNIAALLHSLQTDIAIDLKGYTRGARPGILAYRPAPIQVSYLGYPGTMGTESIDYIIADKIVAPFEHQKFYTEKIVHLPNSYQVNDTRRKFADSVPTRQVVGLPEQGFVFCCFNNNWKITPPIFDIWMRLLHQVEDSVLWLLQDNESAERNLRNEAQKRGIDPSRLIFARRLSLDEHLARCRLADLFLDTLPCNAHTTASDALWVGLPVLTCKGEAFSGRVAASLLNAVGLPELVTTCLEDYEGLAIKLARNTALLDEIKTKIARNRNTFPLFNIERFARHIESAYSTMWEIWQRGEVPRSFSVDRI